jgi:hypothetical protein
MAVPQLRVRLSTHAFHNGRRIRVGEIVSIDLPEDGVLPYGHETCPETDLELLGSKLNHVSARQAADVADAEAEKEAGKARAAVLAAEEKAKKAKEAKRIASEREAAHKAEADKKADKK